MIKDQIKFMKKAEQETDLFDSKQCNLYADLIVEEFDEFCEKEGFLDYNEAQGQYQITSSQLKEGVDCLVVVLAWLISTGVDVKEAWNIVFENNMAKLEEGVVKDSSGKVMKSEKSIERKQAMMDKLQDLINDGKY